MRKILTPPVRRYLYGLSAATVALLVGLEIIPLATGVLIGPFLVALFHVPTPKGQHRA